MASTSVARRYARALMTLGLADGKFEAYADELGRLQQAFEASPELRDLWLNPAYDRNKRVAALESLSGSLGLSTIVLNLGRILIDRQRSDTLPDIAKLYRDMVNEKVGRVDALVTSAEPLSEEQAGQLKQALASLTKKEIILETKVDPALIGGVVTQVGGTILDGSLKTQLELMRGSLRGARV